MYSLDVGITVHVTETPRFVMNVPEMWYCAAWNRFTARTKPKKSHSAEVVKCSLEIGVTALTKVSSLIQAIQMSSQRDSCEAINPGVG